MQTLAASSPIHRTALAVIASLALGSFAWAAPHGDGPVRMSVGDLDFSNARDVELFNRRVDQAARTLCGREGQLDFFEANACRRGVRRRVARMLSDDQRRALFSAKPKTFGCAWR